MEIVELDSLNIVGFKVVSHWSGLSVEMPKAWEQIKQRADEISNQTSTYYYDVCLQLVGEEFTQLVGCEVSDLGLIPEGMFGYRIPKATYIYAQHLLPDYQIPETFQRMIDFAKEYCYKIDPIDFKIQKMSPNEEGHHLYIRII